MTASTEMIDSLVDRFVARYDHHDAEFTPDISNLVDRRILRTTPGIVYSSAYEGMWVLARHRYVKTVLQDKESFSTAQGSFYPRAPGTPRFAPLDYDPPEHTALRAVMRPPLTLPESTAMIRQTRSIAAEHLATIVERGHGDLVAELAVPVALRTIAAVVGFSDEARDQLRSLTSNLFARLSKDESSAAFWPQFARWLEGVIAASRAGARKDYISWLSRDARIDGQPLTDEQIQSTLITFSMAGHASTVNTIGHILWQLVRTPGLPQRLRTEPDLIPAAAEETLRLWTPSDHVTRVATRDVDFDGTVVPRGARVMLLLGAANRDPERFEDPEEFRLERSSEQHLGFSLGIHYCLGLHLARAEFRAVLTETLRHPDYRLLEEPRRTYEDGRHASLDRLLVRFDTSDR